ncbi:MAG: transketolase family protein [Solobacterium sp.]|nr:transketolase family protein [Solobacterium sp.]
MANKISNKEVMCQVLMEHAEHDRDIVVLCSDSRGSASLKPFAERFPKQFIETGIAEQDLVGIAAGLAKCGKKVFAVSPASFLSTRSYEQVKVDVAYSDTNVKLVGISGGVSYGALGMTHHSAQDIAALCALPNMRVYLPCDRFETRALFEALLQDEKPAYIRLGRHAVEDVYEEYDMNFTLDEAKVLRGGDDVLLVGTGETVRACKEAARTLEERCISCAVLDMHCLKPFDKGMLLGYAEDKKLVITVEEHVPHGGLHSLVCQTLSQYMPKPVKRLSLPDEPVIAGTSKEVFACYGLDAAGIIRAVTESLEDFK